MKKYFALCSISLLALTSCYHAQEAADLAEESMVTFNLKLDGVEQGDLTRALAAPTNVLVLDSYKGAVTATTKSSLASISLPLQYGLHDLYFVAATNVWSAYSTNDLTVGWEGDGSLKTVWAYHYQLDVETGTVFEDINLPLVVADVLVKTLDKMPATVSVATVEAPGISSVLDLTTMQASSANGLNRKLDVKAGAGSSIFSANLYTFVPESGKVGDITVAFYSNADATGEIASRTLSAVPVSAGFISQYSGYFFSDGLTIPVTYTTDWLGTNEYTY